MFQILKLSNKTYKNMNLENGLIKLTIILKNLTRI